MYDDVKWRNAAIVYSRCSGMTMKAVSELYGVSRDQIRGIVSHAERYAEVTAKRARMLREAATVEDIPLDALPLSMRAYHGLLNLGCKTVGDAMRLTDAELQTVWNFGRLSLAEVHKMLADMRQRAGDR
jgi:DNA-directed RNA polymerase alpha subunit